MSDDPQWPRAGAWLAAGTLPAEVAVIGIPTHRTSISATRADTTPQAIRSALARFSPYASGIALQTVRMFDAGDVRDPDGAEGETRVGDAVRSIDADVLIGIGGDNSLTYSLALHRWGSDIASAGLITLDAHHDVRDGISNGSPVRRLIEAGLNPKRIVQVGIADFANSEIYAERVRAWGITVIHRSELRGTTMAEAMQRALDIAGSVGGPVHVDLDVDVCDQSVAPACPAAAPGGISADELRIAARCAGNDPRVTSIDIAEIDAMRDSADGRTVRLGALCLLEAVAGFASRPGRGGPRNR